MLDYLMGSVTNGAPDVGSFLLCTACSLFFGFMAAAVYMYRNKHSRTLAMTLVTLPAIVQIIIMLVNGQIGTGIAVAGAFSLIRFRSVPGNAREIGCLFFAMALGFISGLGYLFYAFLFLIIIGGVYLLMTRLKFGQGEDNQRVLRVVIPENVEYNELFNDIFEKYTRSAELDRIKTTQMGSLYELTYFINLRSESDLKTFMDELRCRNSNLSISIGREPRSGEEL